MNFLLLFSLCTLSIVHFLTLINTYTIVLQLYYWCVAETEALTNAPYICIVRSVNYPWGVYINIQNTIQVYGGVNQRFCSGYTAIYEFLCEKCSVHNSGGSRISRRGGGMDLIRGAVDPRGSYVSKILHVKTKESGPVGGARAGRAPPRSANA